MHMYELIVLTNLCSQNTFPLQKKSGCFSPSCPLAPLVQERNTSVLINTHQLCVKMTERDASTSSSIPQSCSCMLGVGIACQVWGSIHLKNSVHTFEKSFISSQNSVTLNQKCHMILSKASDSSIVLIDLTYQHPKMEIEFDLLLTILWEDQETFSM